MVCTETFVTVEHNYILPHFDFPILYELFRQHLLQWFPSWVERLRFACLQWLVPYLCNVPYSPHLTSFLSRCSTYNSLCYIQYVGLLISENGYGQMWWGQFHFNVNASTHFTCTSDTKYLTINVAIWPELIHHLSDMTNHVPDSTF